MNEQFTRQAQEMFNAAREARIPENVQHIAEESVLKTREAYSRLTSAAKDGAQVMEDVMLTSHAGAKSIGEKMLNNTLANTEAAFDAAQAMARARSIQEVARLQADFMQQQYAAATAQSKELLELSSKVARQTFETLGRATSRGLDQFKR